MSINSLPADTYTLQVTDANGCTCGSSATLLQSPTMEIIAINNYLATDSLSDYNIVTVDYQGGIAPYSFDFNTTGDAFYQEVAPNSVIVYYADAVTWDITIYDALGCTEDDLNISSSDFLDIDTPFAIIMYEVVEDSGSSDGSINIDVVNGVQPYTYEWYSDNSTGSLGVNSSYLTGLSAGWYNVIVTDNNTPPESAYGWYFVPSDSKHTGKTAFDELSNDEVGLKVMPNPVINEAKVSFIVPISERVNIQLVGINGQQQATLFDDVLMANTVYDIPLYADKLNKGIYLCRLISDSGLTMTQKVVVY